MKRIHLFLACGEQVHSGCVPRGTLHTGWYVFSQKESPGSTAILAVFARAGEGIVGSGRFFLQSAISAVSFRHSLVRSGVSARSPGFPHGQTVAAPRLWCCEYAYGSGSESRGSRAMGDSYESGRPTFSPGKCVCSARVGGLLASAKPDSQEASRRKRPEYVIVNESPQVPLVPLGTAGAGPPGDGWRRTPSGGAPGPGDDCGNPSARMASAGSISVRHWASLRPSKPAILLGGERPVLGVSRETFFRKRAFSVGIASGI